MTIDEQIAYLTKGCVDVVRRADLQHKLERAADVVKHHEMLGPVTRFLTLIAFQFAPGA